MDLHLNKINIGAVADRAVRGVGLVGLLALTLGPIPLQQANPATAGSLSWGGNSSPAAGGGTVSAIAAADASNGDVFAAAGSKSSGPPTAAWNGPQDQPSSARTVEGRGQRKIPVDGGEDVTMMPAVPDAVNAACMVMDLRISPNYDQDGTIVALCGAMNSTVANALIRWTDTKWLTPSLPFPQTMATVGRRAPLPLGGQATRQCRPPLLTLPPTLMAMTAATSQ